MLEKDPAARYPVHRLGHGDLELEHRAGPRLALHSDLPAHQFDQTLGDIEAKT